MSTDLNPSAYLRKVTDLQLLPMPLRSLGCNYKTTLNNTSISLPSIAEKLPREIWITIFDRSVLEALPIPILTHKEDDSPVPLRIPPIARLLPSYRQIYLSTNTFTIESHGPASEHAFSLWLHSLAPLAISTLKTIVLTAKVYNAQGITSIALRLNLHTSPSCQAALTITTVPGSGDYLRGFCAALGVPLYPLNQQQQEHYIKLAAGAAAGTIDKEVEKGREVTVETLVLALARFRIMLEGLGQEFVRLKGGGWVVPRVWAQRRGLLKR